MAFTYRGYAKLKLGQFQEVIQDCNAALAISKATFTITKFVNDFISLVLTNRAVAKVGLKQFQEAIEDFDAVLATPNIDDKTKSDTLHSRDLAKAKLAQR